MGENYTVAGLYKVGIVRELPARKLGVCVCAKGAEKFGSVA